MQSLILEEFGTAGLQVLEQTDDAPDLMDLMQILDMRTYRRNRAIWEGTDAEAKGKLSEETRNLMLAVDERRVARGW